MFFSRPQIIFFQKKNQWKRRPTEFMDRRALILHSSELHIISLRASTLLHICLFLSFSSSCIWNTPAYWIWTASLYKSLPHSYTIYLFCFIIVNLWKHLESLWKSHHSRKDKPSYKGRLQISKFNRNERYKVKNLIK